MDDNTGEAAHNPPDPPATGAAWPVAGDPLPADDRSRRLIWLPVVLVLLAVACLGSAGYSLYRLVDDGMARRPIDERPVPGGAPGGTARSTAGASASTGAGTTGANANGDAASDYAVAKADDLKRVCDRWYYPQSPPFGGAAPHPVIVNVKERMDFPSRLTKELDDYSSSPAWAPKDPATAQLIACADLVEGGRQIRTCRFDDPAPDTLPLKEGIYQLTLYEVATRRKVFEQRLNGADDDCPYVVLLGSDRTLYTTLSQRQLHDLLRRFVES